MNANSSVMRRVYVILALFLLGFANIAWHLYTLQISRHEELFEKAKRQYTTTQKTKGTRGEIYDWEGNLLVCNIPARNIAYDPTMTDDNERCAEMADWLAGKLGEKRSVLYKKMTTREYTAKDENGNPVTKPRQYTMLARNIDFALSETIREEAKAKKYKGFIFEDSSRREYPKKQLLANVLGFTSMSQDRVVPLAGLERTLDEKMQSEQGSITYERSRDGRRISYGNMEGDPVQDGYNVFLTIREPLQAIVEEELDKMMERTHCKAAYAVMVDPMTGDILAMGQRPTYDPNDRSILAANPDVCKNRIAENYYEPGSVMKPFVISYAMDRGFVTPHTMIDCTAGMWIYARRTLRDTHRVGLVPLGEVIKQSSNIGTAKVSIMMGNKELYNMFQVFGFGKRTGVPLHPETPGFVRPLNKWDGLSIARYCIGQGVGVSALQLARAYCIIANGGYPVNLRLVDRIDRDGITEKYPYYRGPNVFRRADTVPNMHAMMKSVLEPGGTAKDAAIPGYYVCGKTGTAEKFINGQYRKQYMGSFCGFVPSKNPRFVLLVTADEPYKILPDGSKKGLMGGDAAGPTFKAIAERALKYLYVPMECPLEQWEAERKELRRKDHMKRVAEDKRVQAVREARDAAERKKKR